MIWAAVIAGSLGCYALKLWGWVLPARVVEHPVILRLSALLPLTMLAALVVVQTFARGSALVIDARLAGLAAAVAALLLRAPFLVVVVCASAAAAVVRALGWLA